MSFDKVLSRWHRGESCTRKNDTTDGTTLYYRSTPILSRDEQGHTFISTGGWNTLTTTRRLNKVVPPRFRVSNRNWQIFVGNAPWKSESAWLDMDLFERYYDDVNEFLGLLREIRNGHNSLLLENWREFSLGERNSRYVALLYTLGDYHCNGCDAHPAWTGARELFLRPRKLQSWLKPRASEKPTPRKQARGRRVRI